MANPLGSFLGAIGSAFGSAVGEFQKSVRTAADQTGAMTIASGQDKVRAGVVPTAEEAMSMMRRADQQAKGINQDPMAPFSGSTGYFVRPSQLTVEMLEVMAHRTVPYKIAMKIRADQIARFCTPAPDDYTMGCRVVLEDHRATMSRAAERKANELLQFMLACGDPARAGRRLVDDNFGALNRKLVYDSMKYDQANFQVVHRLNGKPYRVLAMPAQTLKIKRQAPQTIAGMWTGECHIPEEKPTDPKFVQVYLDQVIAEFSPAELAWGVRNPSTNLSSLGYGWSELEDAIHVITAFNNTYEYNRRFFTQGTSASGIMSIEGGTPPPKDVLDEFKREWQNLLSGVANAHRVPIITLATGQSIKWTDVGAKTNREMQFTEWMNLQLRIIFALCGMDPAEAGFDFKAGPGESASGFGNQNENKISRSKDRGLRPMMAMLADQYDSRVIKPLHEDFKFEWVGLEVEDETARIEKAGKQVKTFMMVDEVRKAAKLPDMPDGKGKVILDNNWMQFAQQVDGAQQQEAGQDAMGGPFGAEGFGGQGGDDGQQGQPDDQQDKGQPPANKAQAIAKSLRGRVRRDGLDARWWSEADEAELRHLHMQLAQQRATPFGVALHKAIVGVEPIARGEAAEYGLHVEQVGRWSVFGHGPSDVDPLVKAIRAGVDPESADGLEAAGADDGLVLQRRRYEALTARKDAAVARQRRALVQ